MSTLKVNNIQSSTPYPPYILDSSGKEIGKLATAWVSFHSDGTILNSFNVISITASSTNQYVLSFTPGLRINNPAVAGSSNASGNIVHPVIYALNEVNRNQQYVFSSHLRVRFVHGVGTVEAQENSTYHTITVIGDNAYGSAGSLMPLG